MPIRAKLRRWADAFELLLTMVRPRLEGWRIWAWLVALVAVPAGVAALTTLRSGNGTAANLVFRLEEYRLWRVLITGVTVIGVLVWPSIFGLYKSVVDLDHKVSGIVGLKGQERSRPIEVDHLWVLYWLLLVGLLAGNFLTSRSDPLPAWPWRTTALVAIGMLITAPALVGIWLSAVTLRRLRDAIGALDPPAAGELAWGAPQAEILERLREFPTLLQRLLATLSAAVSAVTLSTGALRLAVLKTPSGSTWPAADPVLYGAWFAALLALLPAGRHRPAGGPSGARRRGRSDPRRAAHRHLVRGPRAGRQAGGGRGREQGGHPSGPRHPRAGGGQPRDHPAPREVGPSGAELRDRRRHPGVAAWLLRRAQPVVPPTPAPTRR